MSIWKSRYKNPITYLLLENGDYLLLESGSKIVLDQTGQGTSSWSQRTKN